MSEQPGPSYVKRIKLDPSLEQEEEEAASTVYLPEDVLFSIFTFLEPRNKKQCILVDKTWNWAMQRPSLGLDMKFNFTESPSPAPISQVYQIFMQSERPVYNLTIEIADLPDVLDEKDDFFEKIGQNVRILNLKASKKPDIVTFLWDFMKKHLGERDKFIIKSLKYFPLLEKLVVEEPEMLKILQDIPSSVNVVHVEKMKRWIKVEVAEIIQSIPNLQKVTADEINIKSPNDDDSDDDEYDEEAEPKEPSMEFFTISKEFKDFDVGINFASYSLKNQVNLLNGAVVELSDVSLKALNITQFRLARYRNSELMKAAEISIPNNNYNYDPCWFTHSVRPIPNLESITIDNVANEALNCKRCLKFFAESAPGLKKLDLTANTAKHFENLFKFGKEFTEIKINTNQIPIQPLQLFKAFKPDRLNNLKILVLNYVKCADPQDWNNWPKMLNLEDLRMNLYYRNKDPINYRKGLPVPSPSVGIEKIAKKCPQLRILELNDEIHDLRCSQLKVFLLELPFLMAFHTSGITHEHEMDELDDDDDEVFFTPCDELMDARKSLIKRLDVFSNVKLSKIIAKVNRNRYDDFYY